jgi:cytochrome c peroxidase
MHDGRFNTLEEVVEHYNSGGHYAENRSPLIYPLELTEQEQQNIVAFLHTLTDTTFMNQEILKNPFE